MDVPAGPFPPAVVSPRAGHDGFVVPNEAPAFVTIVLDERAFAPGGGVLRATGVTVGVAVGVGVGVDPPPPPTPLGGIGPDPPPPPQAASSEMATITPAARMVDLIICNLDAASKTPRRLSSSLLIIAAAPRNKKFNSAPSTGSCARALLGLWVHKAGERSSRTFFPGAASTNLLLR